jgi:hypothetical protein
MSKSHSKGRAGRQLRAKERAFSSTAVPAVIDGRDAHPTDPGVTVEVFPDDLKCGPALKPQYVVVPDRYLGTTSCDAPPDRRGTLHVPVIPAWF